VAGSDAKVVAMWKCRRGHEKGMRRARRDGHATWCVVPWVGVGEEIIHGPSHVPVIVPVDPPFLLLQVGVALVVMCRARALLLLARIPRPYPIHLDSCCHADDVGSLGNHPPSLLSLVIRLLGQGIVLKIKESRVRGLTGLDEAWQPVSGQTAAPWPLALKYGSRNADGV